MPVSGLIVTASDEAALARLRHTLSDDPSIISGEIRGARWALVVDTPEPGQDRETWARLDQAPGVLSVDVVFVHFESATRGSSTRSV